MVQAFFHDESYYTEFEWNRLISGFSLVGALADETFFPSLAATSRLSQMTRKVLSQVLVSQQETEHLMLRASALYNILTKRLSDFLGRLNRAREDWGRDIDSWKAKLRHAVCSRNYGLTLSTQIVVNSILATLHGD